MRPFLQILLIFIFALPAQAASATTWRTNCKEKLCELYSEIKQKNKDKDYVLSRLIIQDVAEKNSQQSSPTALVSLPLGIYIPDGVSVKIDNGSPVKWPLIDCRKEMGCRAVSALTSKLALQMKRGRVMTFSVVDKRRNRTINLDYSLMGFTAAYRKFSKNSVKARR